jgi:hypothetical protein
VAGILSNCAPENLEDSRLTKYTYLELVDWHISGFGIINSPVAWVRVSNYNPVPVKDIVLKYTTYDFERHVLNEGTYVIEETVPPGVAKDFIELYLGLVDLHSEQLSVQIQSVRASN